MPTQQEMRASNAIKEVKYAYDTADRWAILETLPHPVRYMIANAPLDYSIFEIAKDYHAWYEEARYGDQFSFFVNGPSTPDVWEYVANMDAAFRRDVINNDYTGTNPNGSYEVVPTVHAKRQPSNKNISRRGGQRSGRRGFFFPSIPVGPERRLVAG